MLRRANPLKHRCNTSETSKSVLGWVFGGHRPLPLLPISNFNLDSSIFGIKVPFVRSCLFQLLMSHDMAMYENQVSHVLLMFLQAPQSSVVGAKQAIFATPRSFHHFQLQEGCGFGIHLTVVQSIHQIIEAATIAEGGGHFFLGVIQITHFDTPGSGTFREPFHHAGHTTGLALQQTGQGCNMMQDKVWLSKHIANFSPSDVASNLVAGRLVLWVLIFGLSERRLVGSLGEGAPLDCFTFLLEQS